MGLSKSNNPTADIHPFHWHLVRAQCGPSEDQPNTNELRDVFPIPPSPDGSYDVTQVCYVACTPGNYLIENSTIAPTNFGFPLTIPYLVHCHILEHEENMMMSWFLPKNASSSTNDVTRNVASAQNTLMNDVSHHGHSLPDGDKDSGIEKEDV